MPVQLKRKAGYSSSSAVKIENSLNSKSKKFEWSVDSRGIAEVQFSDKKGKEKWKAVISEVSIADKNDPRYFIESYIDYEN